MFWRFERIASGEVSTQVGTRFSVTTCLIQLHGEIASGGQTENAPCRAGGNAERFGLRRFARDIDGEGVLARGEFRSRLDRDSGRARPGARENSIRGRRKSYKTFGIRRIQETHEEMGS